VVKTGGGDHALVSTTAVEFLPWRSRWAYQANSWHTTITKTASKGAEVVVVRLAKPGVTAKRLLFFCLTKEAKKEHVLVVLLVVLLLFLLVQVKG